MLPGCRHLSENNNSSGLLDLLYPEFEPVNNEEEFVTCKNCKMTTLASIFQTKLVSQMMIKADQTKLENFTCLNGFLAFSEIMFNE